MVNKNVTGGNIWQPKTTSPTPLYPEATTLLSFALLSILYLTLIQANTIPLNITTFALIVLLPVFIAATITALIRRLKK